MDAKSDRLLGKISADNNKFAIAAGNLEATLKVYPSLQGYKNLGYIYDELSNIDAAILAYKDALAIAPNDMEIHNSLGHLYKDSGKFDLAINHLEMVRNNTKQGEEIWFMATVNLGSVYYEIGRKSNNTDTRKNQCAIALHNYFQPSLEFRGAIKSQIHVAKTLVNTANCLKDTGDLAGAEKLTQEALLIKRKINADASMADTLVNLADALLKQEKYIQAKPYLLEATSIFELTGNQLGIGAAYFNLGDISWASGNSSDARGFYEKSLEYFIIARVGGEYEQAPKRRLERMQNKDVPEFVRKAKDKKRNNTQGVRHQTQLKSS